MNKRNKWSVKFTIIEIDDAGTGDLVGDAIIGFYVPEKEKYLFKNIPVNYFQEPKWQEKYPLKYTATLIENALIELEFNPKTDQISICTGNIFDDARKMFKDKNIKFVDAKIVGNLQDRVEQAYLDHLKIIGVDISDITIESGKKRYFQLFSWVVDDFHKRKKFVKSGFKGWVTKWEKIALSRFRKKSHSKSQSGYKSPRKPHYDPRNRQYKGSKNFKPSQNRNNNQPQSNLSHNTPSNNPDRTYNESRQKPTTYSKVPIKPRNSVKENFHGKKFN